MKQWCYYWNQSLAIGLQREKMAMKFKDAITNIAIITKTTEEIYGFGKISYNRNTSFDHIVEITYQNDSKYNCMKDEEEINVFVDILVKLSHYFDYEFNSLEEVYDFVEGISNRVWWDHYDSIDSICHFITSATGRHFEDYL